MAANNCYRIQLWRYQYSRGWEEERIITHFFPSLINGFAILVNSMRRRSNEKANKMGSRKGRDIS
jgi:hypothetical protein